MKRKGRVLAACLAAGAGALAIAPMSAEAQYVSWNKSGRPSFYFDGGGAAYKDKLEVTLSTWYSDKIVASTDDCGYKRVTKGKAASIGGFQLDGTTVSVASLPEFDGTCSSGTLTPKTAGDAVPASHYQKNGSVYVKTVQGKVIRVRYADYPKSLTADKCGNYKLLWPKPILMKADGSVSKMPTDSSVTVNGTLYSLEDMEQNKRIIKCTTTYEPDASGIIDKVQRLFEI